MRFYPACQGTASLIIDIPHPCGDCARRTREGELNEKIAQFAAGTSEYVEAEKEYWREQFVMSTIFPRLEHKKRYKPLKIHLPTREMRGSLLRTEVLSEDIKEDLDEILGWEAYYDEWKTAPSYASAADAEVPSSESEDATETPDSTAGGWASDDTFASEQTTVDSWAASDGTSWESDDANDSGDSTAGGWASDDTFAPEQTAVDAWVASDGNAQNSDLASTWAWGGDRATRDHSAFQSKSTSEELSQHEGSYANGGWIEDTVEKVDGLGGWNDMHTGEKEGKDAAFCVLMDSLTQSFSDRVLLGTGMV